MTETKHTKKCERIILAVDFDNTITSSEGYPGIAEIRRNAAYYINKLYDEGYIIIIFTCREGIFAEEARRFLNIHGVRYDLFNENHPIRIHEYSDARKISADIYIDDKGINGIPRSWRKIYKKVKKFSKKLYM